jgi:hypothetical protein
MKSIYAMAGADLEGLAFPRCFSREAVVAAGRTV